MAVSYTHLDVYKRQVYSFGLYYIYCLLRDGPSADANSWPAGSATGNRPLAFAGHPDTATGRTGGQEP